VRCGTLTPNQILIAGTVHAKVRWIYDFSGKSVKEALPGYPIEFTGFPNKESLPKPGDIAIQVGDASTAEKIIKSRLRSDQLEHRTQARFAMQEAKIQEEEDEKWDRLKAIELGVDEEEYLRDLKAKKEEEQIVMNVDLMIKSEVSGSIEAIKGLIDKFPNDELQVRVVKTGIGAISESDIKQASTADSKLVVLGFDVKITEQARSLASQLGVIVNTFDIIYNLMDWIRDYCSKKLPPDVVYVDVASCLIQEVFELKVKGKNGKNSRVSH